jgi:uncharacterized protein YcfL
LENTPLDSFARKEMIEKIEEEKKKKKRAEKKQQRHTIEYSVYFIDINGLNIHDKRSSNK